MNLKTLEKANELSLKIQDIEQEIGFLCEEFITVDFINSDDQHFSIVNIDSDTWDAIRLILSTSLKDKLNDLKDEFKRLCCKEAL
ncbi:MAG: hypothetical protein PHO27_12110 [Sulfuricurvum sp.]|jgi:thioredoxin reductase|nr:hypothetical protein [Sulfuricurvum sp.]